MRKILLFLTVAACLAVPVPAHGDAIATYDHPQSSAPSINQLTGLPLHPCKYEDPFSAKRSCYWDARLQGNHRGKSYDVYLHWSTVRHVRVLTRVCVAYWDIVYSVSHNWCQHASTVVFVNGY